MTVKRRSAKRRIRASSDSADDPHSRPVCLLRKGPFRRRMLRLIDAVKRSGYGHDGIECERTVGSLSEWVFAEPSRILYATDPSHAVWSLLQRDPGYLAAVKVVTGETKFYLCTDCRFPMTKDDRKGGCPVCGDFWSGERPTDLSKPRLGKHASGEDAVALLCEVARKAHLLFIDGEFGKCVDCGAENRLAYPSGRRSPQSARDASRGKFVPLRHKPGCLFLRLRAATAAIPEGG